MFERGARVQIKATGELGLVRHRYRCTEDDPWRVAVRLDEPPEGFVSAIVWVAEDDVAEAATTPPP